MSMTLADLRQFEQFALMSDEQLILMKSHLKSYTCSRSGELVLPLGSYTPQEFFLIEGKIRLEDESKNESYILAGSNEAKLSIARVRPTKFEVTSASACKFLVVPPGVLQKMAQTSPVPRKAIEVKSEAGQIILQAIYAEVDRGNFKLPPMPEAAQKIREILENDSASWSQVAQIIEKEPVIASRLVAAANSPLFRGIEPSNTIADAVQRLGTEVTYELVLSFSIHDLFGKKELQWAKNQVVAIWDAAVEISTICQMLSKKLTKLNSARALLLGLIHNIGELALIDFLTRSKKEYREDIELLTKELSLPLTVLLLQTWGYTEEFIDNIENSYKWFAVDEKQEADYADVLILAKLHYAIGKPWQYKMPRIDEVPSYQKLAPGELTKTTTLEIVETSKASLMALKQLLRGR